MLNPSTLLDSNTSNDNARLLAGANPADSCSTGRGSVLATRRPHVDLSNNDSVTLGGAVYNFCQINLGNNSSINVATGAKILTASTRRAAAVALERPARAACRPATAQRCPTRPRTRRALQIVIFGQAPAWPTIELPNNITIYGAIYAPNTGIQFKNNGEVVGGITAQSIEFKNNAFTGTPAHDIHFATTLVYYRGAWRQCSSRVASTTAPSTGCL